METNLYSQNDFRSYQELAHSGRLGQKWGVKHGPPYPLDERQLTGAYKKNGGLSESAKEKYGHSDGGSGGRSTQGRNTSGKGLTKAQKAIEDENRKYSSATAEMKALTADCWHPESVDWREMIKGESKDAKRAIAAADLGLKAIEKVRGPGYIDDDETFTKELMAQEGYTRDKAEKIAKNSNREWFLYEDQTIGLPTIADLVNQGYTPEQVSKLADRVNRRADDYYDELDSSSSMFTTKTERDVFGITDSSWNDENKKFAEACYKIKNGKDGGRTTKGLGKTLAKLGAPMDVDQSAEISSRNKKIENDDEEFNKNISSMNRSEKLKAREELNTRKTELEEALSESGKKSDIRKSGYEIATEDANRKELDSINSRLAQLGDGKNSGRNTTGLGDSFNKNTIDQNSGPRQRGESNAEYEQRKDMLKDATKSLINNNTKTAAEQIGQRNRNAKDAAKLERRIDKLARNNIGGINDKKIRELAATRDMKIENLTREEIELARKQLQNSKNIKMAALGGAMIGLTTGTPVTTAAAFAVGSAVINRIVDGGSTSKLQDKVNRQHSDIAIRREVEQGRALPNWAEQRAKEIGATRPAKQPKLSDQAWDRAYDSLQKKLERIDYDGDKLNVATLSPEEQQVYYEVISS